MNGARPGSGGGPGGGPGGMSLGGGGMNPSGGTGGIDACNVGKLAPGDICGCAWVRTPGGRSVAAEIGMLPGCTALTVGSGGSLACDAAAALDVDVPRTTEARFEASSAARSAAEAGTCTLEGGTAAGGVSRGGSLRLIPVMADRSSRTSVLESAAAAAAAAVSPLSARRRSDSAFIALSSSTFFRIRFWLPPLSRRS